jgi:hypothetical protein
MMAAETAAIGDMPLHVFRLVGAYEGLRGYYMLPEGLSRRCGEDPAEAGHYGGEGPAKAGHYVLLPRTAGQSRTLRTTSAAVIHT